MGIFYSKNNIGSGNPHWKGGDIKRICEICGKEFNASKCMIKSGRGKFCSYKCHGVWKTRNLTGKNSPTWKGGRVNITCGICGKEFNATPSIIKNGDGKFCSRHCFGIWKSENLTGINSPFWKGGRGKTSHGATIRASKKYSEWRTKIFKHDNFTCQKCGKYGGELQAHHKKRFSVILNDIKQEFPLLSISDIAINYPNLWDIKNGITLCKRCHKIEHKTWGNK
jgi:hypothetical protein